MVAQVGPKTSYKWSDMGPLVSPFEVNTMSCYCNYHSSNCNFFFVDVTEGSTHFTVSSSKYVCAVKTSTLSTYGIVSLSCSGAVVWWQLSMQGSVPSCRPASWQHVVWPTGSCAKRFIMSRYFGKTGSMSGETLPRWIASPGTTKSNGCCVSATFGIRKINGVMQLASNRIGPRLETWGGFLVLMLNETSQIACAGINGNSWRTTKASKATWEDFAWKDPGARACKLQGAFAPRPQVARDHLPKDINLRWSGLVMGCFVRKGLWKLSHSIPLADKEDSHREFLFHRGGLMPFSPVWLDRLNRYIKCHTGPMTQISLSENLPFSEEWPKTSRHNATMVCNGHLVETHGGGRWQSLPTPVE